MRFATAAILISLALLPACNNKPVTDNAVTGPANPTAPSEVMLVGRLLGSIMAIGGDTTGWAIERPAPPGEPLRTEIDCTKVMRAAEKLDGKQVRVHGRWETREYVERGPQQILIVESIEAVGE